MKLTVFGGTGRTGRLVVAQAEAAGHAVTVLARDPSAVVAERVIAGSATDPRAVAEAVRGQDALVLALSPGGTPGGVEAMVRTITSAAEGAGVRRVVLTSAYGMVADRPRIAAPLVRRFLRSTFADQRAADELLQASGLDWTIVRATRLTGSGSAEPARRATEPLQRGPWSIGRGVLATVLLDLASTGAHAREIVNVSG